MIDQLHFLRPDWFYAFIPLALFIVFMMRRHNNSMSWKSYCDSKLLPYILIPSSGKASRLPLALIVIAGSLSIIAAAGPVLEKLPQPVFREQSSLIIIMDLSQSMDATDLRPSRLERAKLKVLDILKLRKGGQTALIAYAANAFVVTPLTDDTNTIANLVPTLETGLMPAQGSNAHLAINKSAELLQQAGVNSGHVLLITDGISSDDMEAISMLSARGHRLSILGIGTVEGSPIPLNGGFLTDANGAIVIPRLDQQQLQQAALTGNGLYMALRIDDSDIETLNKLFSIRNIKSEKKEQTLGELDLTADLWKEEGPWLLLLVIPIAALWSRKGWLLCLPIISFNLVQPAPAHAFELQNMWSSDDQKAMRAFNQGDLNTAAEQFENERWKSSAHYRAGDYEQSIEALRNPTTSDDFYNKGNALAKLGRYQEAVKAYDKALELNTENKDASYNRELVKKELEKQQDNQQNEQSDKNQDENNQQQDTQQSENQQGDSQQQDQNQTENNTDSQQNQQQQESENTDQQDASEQNQQDASEQNQQAEQNKDQASEQPSSQENPGEKPESSEEDVKQALQDAQEKDRAEELGDNQEKESVTLSKNKDNEMLSEDEQAIEQWLKRIQDDPGMLLRRKFAREHRLQNNQQADEQPW